MGLSDNELGFYYTLNDAWTSMCEQVLEGEEVAGTHEKSNVRFTLLDINENLLTTRHNFSLPYYLGEMTWYGVGSNETDFISKFGKIWERLSDDGVTNNSAYGYILKYKHGFNQIDKMIELLKEDPNSRRAVININVPNENVIETNDEMCTIALQFLLRDGELNATGIMRSNDLWTGTPYDIFYFTEIQKYIARSLGVGYGTYTHFVTSMHIYDRDLGNIENSIDAYYKGKDVNIEIDGEKLLNWSQSIFDTVKNSDDHKKEIVEVCERLGIWKEI